MDVSGDYTDSEHELSDSSEQSEFVRPILTREGNSLPVHRGPSKVSKVTKPRKLDRRSKNGPDAKIISLVLVDGIPDVTSKVHVDSREDEKLDEEIFITEATEHYEYGDAVDGYKFIGNKAQYDRWRENKELKAENYTSNDSSDETIDPLAFDRRRSSDLKPGESLDSQIINYWRSDRKRVLFFPILKNCTSNGAEIEEITKDNIEQFYLRSCLLLGVEMRGLLKKERVFWHPDKMVGMVDKTEDNRFHKVTKIFQIINDLWESL